MKFINKLDIISAFQLTKESRWDNSGWPKWLHEAWNKPRFEEGSVYPSTSNSSNDDELALGLGNHCSHTISLGSWIVKGKHGLVAMKNDDFQECYTSFPNNSPSMIGELASAVMKHSGHSVSLQITQKSLHDDAKELAEAVKNGARIDVVDNDGVKIATMSLCEGERAPTLTGTLDRSNAQSLVRKFIKERPLSYSESMDCSPIEHMEEFHKWLCQHQEKKND